MSAQVEQFHYDNKAVKQFAYATAFWGLIGMTAGLLAALQLVWPQLNFDLPQTSFGRVRPIHTNAVIFAFVGNGIFMGVYYSLQRLCKARMWSDKLSSIHFWGWQSIIVLGALTLAWGMTSGKEYAELEWPIDILITIIWVVFGINMFMTIFKRRERHLYVAIWFYIATWVTVALLHIVNSFEYPISLFKSYSWYAGVQDALIQWWYGHNAVAFFLTTPYLGMMYYFIPKAANRPVYSYRLSIIHFWALIFIYIWAGPHHLLYTSLPDWAQSLGVVFSIMLIAPSWGGMINGLLTLRGAWDKVRDDVVLKFMVVAVTAYGMATFEGPMLALKNVNAISHFTDWTIAHVHVGALGWNGFLTFGVLYWLVPKMWNTKIYSKKWANWHFWIGTLGILLYAVPMYWAGWRHYEMMSEFTSDGVLRYSFVDMLDGMKNFYMLRSLGGLLYLIGVVFMVLNIWKTIKVGSFIANEAAEAPALAKNVNIVGKEHWHRAIERRPVQLLIISLVVVAIGGVLEIVPTFLVKSNVPTIASVQPYTPLELEGRDIYIREGCHTCHSQMIRPFRSEVHRYGEYSKAGEFVYDHPFQWGSKRSGPDLAREGGKYNNSWHFNHMAAPREMETKSIMPSYSWLLTTMLDTSLTASKISAMRTMGVPYPEGYESLALTDLDKQAQAIYESLKPDDVAQKLVRDDEGNSLLNKNSEIMAVIAYLQRMGTDIKSQPQQTSGAK
ncbi:MAG: cytochrome-c oxidase, cbb3-type subunit I [Flavobacteriales bacterium]|nr:cytochrome-c oxidase, cbb3-type subunit I [Flavobacteriales bacterium]